MNSGQSYQALESTVYQDIILGELAACVIDILGSHHNRIRISTNASIVSDNLNTFISTAVICGVSESIKSIFSRGGRCQILR